MRDEAARVVNKVVGDKYCKALGEGSVCDETYMSMARKRKVLRPDRAPVVEESGWDLRLSCAPQVHPTVEQAFPAVIHSMRSRGRSTRHAAEPQSAVVSNQYRQMPSCASAAFG